MKTPRQNYVSLSELVTQRLRPSDLDLAAELLAQGKLVAFPTETVYGLGADARNDTAVARVFEAKGRPSFNPLIVHVASFEAAAQIVVFDEAAQRLADAFWPGPLSLVLPVRPDAGLSALVSAGLPTVAIRVPAQDLARDLLTRAGRPIAAPSANPSGMISPTTAAHVLSGLEGRIDAVIDDGPCTVGLESTILSTDPLCQLRPGGLPLSALEACLGQEIKLKDHADAREGPVNSPGQLASHYAPRSRLRMNVERPEPDELMISFGQSQSPNSSRAAYNLSANGDLMEAAAALFATLHMADAKAQILGKTLAIAPIPDIGLGLAINDRLRRAAA